MSDGNKPPNNLPVVKQVDEVIQNALKDILNPSQKKLVTDRLKSKLEMIVTSSAKYHSGPLPSVETVQGYEAVAPGSFERILTMAEKDQHAVITSTEFKARKDAGYRTMAMALGFAALLLILGTIIYLAINGHGDVSIAVAGLGAAGVISAFVNARFPGKQ